MSTMLQIVKVVLMTVGLLLEADMEIGLCPVAIFYVQHQPFGHIPHEEGQIEQLALLVHMNKLMIQVVAAQFGPGEDKLAKGDGKKVFAHGQPFHLEYAFHKRRRASRISFFTLSKMLLARQISYGKCNYSPRYLAIMARHFSLLTGFERKSSQPAFNAS